MFEPDDEITFKEIYRDYLSAELSRPEVAKAKKELLSSFFVSSAPSFSLFSAGFFAPAAVLLLGVFMVAHFQSRQLAVEGPAVPLYRMFGTIMDEARERDAERQAQTRAEAERKALLAYHGTPKEDPLRNHMKPRVVVKRIASQVGPTLVYQKAYKEVPVTIIWVFPGGGQRP